MKLCYYHQFHRVESFESIKGINLHYELLWSNILNMDLAGNITNSTDATRRYNISLTAAILFLLAYIFIFIFGVIGNAYVIVAVLLSKKLRTFTNIFIVNQSCSDLLSCFFIIFLISGNNTTLCRISTFLVIISVQCSIFNIGAIAINRYILITKSNSNYRRFFTSPLTNCIMVASTWIIPITIDLVPTFVGSFGDEKEGSRLPVCGMFYVWPVSAIHSYIVGGTVAIPLIAIFVSYISILIFVRRHFDQQRATAESQPGAVSTLEFAEKGATINRLAQLDQQQLEITKNLFIVVIVFSLFVIPNAIARFFPDDKTALFITGIFILVSGALNPIIYLRKHPHFRVVLVSMLKCRCAEIPEKSDFLNSILKTEATSVA